MRKTVCIALCILCFVLSAQATVEPVTGEAKYVFFMIGDGMASVQVHAAEAYLAALETADSDGAGVDKSVDLAMNTELPYVGMQKTWAWNQLITDSAAAGTALACGYKTYAGAISVSPEDPNMAYPTLAELAKQQGKKVGILSSVSLDHATPAVFYAHQESRNNYYEIGYQGATNGLVDFFGGGTFKESKWPADVNMWGTFTDNGYTVVDSLAELANIPNGTKCVAALDETYSYGSAAMMYAIDRPIDAWSLDEVTAEAIRVLDNDNGFFMMVESGKIDWSCHANDARTSIDDTIEFDKACQVVIEFAKQHPGECLIVVTADHETGGLTQGWAGTFYASGYENLSRQTMSYEAFDQKLRDYQNDPLSLWNLMSVYVEVFGGDDADVSLLNLADDAQMKSLISDAFGLNYDQLSELDQDKLEEAYDRQLSSMMVTAAEEDYLLYGGYSPLGVTCTHLLNARAGLGWTSYSHTAVPVQVLSNDMSFSGYYDNTDVAKKIAAIMGVTLD